MELGKPILTVYLAGASIAIGVIVVAALVEALPAEAVLSSARLEVISFLDRSLIPAQCKGIAMRRNTDSTADCDRVGWSLIDEPSSAYSILRTVDPSNPEYKLGHSILTVYLAIVPV